MRYKAQFVTMIPTEDASARKREIEEKLRQVGNDKCVIITSPLSLSLSLLLFHNLLFTACCCVVVAAAGAGDSVLHQGESGEE